MAVLLFVLDLLCSFKDWGTTEKGFIMPLTGKHAKDGDEDGEHKHRGHQVG
uniref:Uncharacterized protein n=1 Tax=Aegilops tauschii TaxID=37682 RepID=R7W8U2_AEGTA